MHLSDALLDGADSLAWVQALRARVGAVHDGVATVELERVVQELQARTGESECQQTPHRTPIQSAPFSLTSTATFSSREASFHRNACSRTAVPRYLSAFHQYDGHDVEQQAQRMHSYKPSSFLRSSLLCRSSLLMSFLGFFSCSQGLMLLYWS